MRFEIKKNEGDGTWSWSFYDDAACIFASGVPFSTEGEAMEDAMFWTRQIKKIKNMVFVLYVKDAPGESVC